MTTTRNAHCGAQKFIGDFARLRNRKVFRGLTRSVGVPKPLPDSCPQRDRFGAFGGQQREVLSL